MRVISGKYKGKKLKCLEGLKTRPTLDRVKESLFNIIQFEIEGKCVLDLFAGSGQLGIECLSRGALKADFCEADKNAYAVLKANLTNIENAYTYNLDYKNFLLFHNKDNYDIIFIDPPFGEDLYSDAIVKALTVLNDGGQIICESGLDHSFDNYTNLVKTEKTYGSVKLTFLKLERV